MAYVRYGLSGYSLGETGQVYTFNQVAKELLHTIIELNLNPLKSPKISIGRLIPDSIQPTLEALVVKVVAKELAEEMEVERVRDGNEQFRPATTKDLNTDNFGRMLAIAIVELLIDKDLLPESFYEDYESSHLNMNDLDETFITIVIGDDYQNLGILSDALASAMEQIIHKIFPSMQTKETPQDQGEGWKTPGTTPTTVVPGHVVHVPTTVAPVGFKFTPLSPFTPGAGGGGLPKNILLYAAIGVGAFILLSK